MPYFNCHRILFSNALVQSWHSPISSFKPSSIMNPFFYSFALVSGVVGLVQHFVGCHASSSWQVVNILRFALMMDTVSFVQLTVVLYAPSSWIFIDNTVFAFTSGQLSLCDTLCRSPCTVIVRSYRFLQLCPLGSCSCVGQRTEHLHRLSSWQVMEVI